MSDNVSRLFNWVIVTIGGLVVAFAGPCTLFFGGGALVELVRGGDAALAGFILVTALIVGGIPLAGGVVMVVVGLRSLRRQTPS